MRDPGRLVHISTPRWSADCNPLPLGRNTFNGKTLHMSNIPLGRCKSNGENLMQPSSPYTYHLSFSLKNFPASNPPKEKWTLDEEVQFSAPVTKKGRAKLYVISHNDKPIYVGATISSIGVRLNQGLGAKYGYQWRDLKKATIDVWMLEDVWMLDEVDTKTMETIEGEVVFLIRQHSGQWPDHQTEIHFHQSSTEHRDAAHQVISHYRSLYAQSSE